MSRVDVWYMVRRRAVDAGIETPIRCHTFRATGITDYLTNGGRIEVAQKMAGHSNAARAFWFFQSPRGTAVPCGHLQCPPRRYRRRDKPRAERGAVPGPSNQRRKRRLPARVSSDAQLAHPVPFIPKSNVYEAAPPCSTGTRPSACPPRIAQTWLEYMPPKSRQNQIVRLQTSSLHRTVEEAGIKETPPSSIARFSFCPIHPELRFFAATLAKKNEMIKRRGAL
jgi:hypothetical protein